MEKRNGFNVGDIVKVVQEDLEPKYIGEEGEVVEILTDGRTVYIVKMNAKLDIETNNDVARNTRAFYEFHLDINKNAIVRNILNDL